MQELDSNVSDMPLVSVVMPAFRSANTIGRSINSIIAQTYKKWELLVVIEQNSDSETIDEIKKYQDIDNRVKMLVNKNRPGIPGSLNYGLEKANGKYIARMDADDFSYAERFERQVDYLESNPEVSVCGSSLYLVSPKGKEFLSYPLSYDQIKAGLLFYCCIPHPSVMFRQDRNFRYDDKCEVAEDYALWLSIIGRNRIENIEEPLIEYNYDGKTNKSAQVWDVLREKVYEIQSEHLKESLGIEKGSFPKILTGYEYPMHYWKDHPNMISEVYRALSTIQDKNNQHKYCDERILNREIIRNWNMFVERYYNPCLYSTPNAVDICIENHESTVSLKMALAHKLSICEEDTDLWIERINESLCLMADTFQKIIVYGVGNDFKKYSDYLSESFEIVSYVDSAKHGQNYNGYTIRKPDTILKEKYDHILISSSKYYEEIYDFLTNKLGVESIKVKPMGIIRFRHTLRN